MPPGSIIVLNGTSSSGKTTLTAHRRGAQAALRAHRLLLESDARLPSLVTLIAGGPVRGSWWGHPLGGLIFEVSNWLAARPGVLLTRLVSGKVTFVHRSLWPAVFAIGSGHASWQLCDLSPEALRLLGQVRQDGLARTDDIPWSRSASGRSPGDAARELEARLLVYSAQVHTEKGSHAKQLETWEHWAESKRFKSPLLAPAHAQTVLEQALQRLNRRFAAHGKLPWQ